MKKERIHFGDVFEAGSERDSMERHVVVGVLKGVNCFETRIYRSEGTGEDYVLPMFISTTRKSDIAGRVIERWGLGRVLAVFERGYLNYGFPGMEAAKREGLWNDAREYYIKVSSGVS